MSSGWHILPRANTVIGIIMTECDTYMYTTQEVLASHDLVTFQFHSQQGEDHRCEIQCWKLMEIMLRDRIVLRLMLLLEW